MKFLFDIKRMLRWKKVYEIWDTSAISIYLDELKKSISKGTKIVIPEGVMREILVGKRKYKNCMEVYEFLTENMYIIYELPRKKEIFLTIDEQIIAVAERYIKKGYDVYLVTCDKEQAFKARFRNIKVNLWAIVEVTSNFLQKMKKHNKKQ